jgi:hypothetical protein
MKHPNPINADTKNDRWAAKDRPATLLWFTCASIALSLTIFILLLAWGDFGISSLFIGPVTAFLTVIYHATILVIARRRRPTDTPTPSPATSKASVVLAFILTFAWFIASNLTNAQTALDCYRPRQIPGMVLQNMQFGVMLVVAAVAAHGRRMELSRQQWYEL